MASAVGGAASAAAPAVDDVLYSRQLYVMGHAAQARMSQSNILIVGVRGVGVELAKNIILMGVKSVSLYDPNPTEWTDLSAQFYLTPEDVGHPRAARCVDKLAELNQYVTVSALPEATIDEAVARRFHVIVATDQPAAEALRLAALARTVGAKFVLGEGRGVVGRVFCDFGASFVCDDTTGENPISCMIHTITNAAEGEAKTDEIRHGLSDGDYVTFSEVQGMTELNGCVPRQVKVTGPYSFTIGDTSGLSKHIRGGWVHQVKMPVTLAFKPLAAMVGPVGSATGPSFEEVVTGDFAKFEYPPALHAAFSALHDHMAAHGGKAPGAGEEKHVEAVVAATQAFLGTGDDAKMSPAVAGVVTHFARTALGQLSPIAAVIGGIAAQEVLKAVSGKFGPLRQWFYFDAVEALPNKADAPLPVAETTLAGTRYDGQIAVFGKSMQDRIAALRYFLVGAGAIGCEVLKAWAMMGVASAPSGGHVTVTDMDRIEKSNLSRQFLFRSGDIGKAKSTTAVAAATAMNPAFKGTAIEQRVGGDSEGVFNDTFWSELDGVCTALDNVDARLYVDSRCVYYGKPLLESGTLGTKGNTQIVVPRLTENYGATRDPPEQGIPVCTLKSFPFKIEHTLQWARDWYEDEYKQVPDAANAYIAHGGEYLATLARQQNTRMDTLEKIHAALVTGKPETVEDCVKWSRAKFDELFNHNIKQLLFNYPPDAKDKTGEPFWTGARRQPTPLEFSADDATHMAFVAAATQLRAGMYNIPLTATHSAEWLRTAAAAVVLPKWEPRAGVTIAANEKELEEQKAKEAAAAGTGAAGAASGGAVAAAAATAAPVGWDVDERAAAVEAKLPAAATLKAASYSLSALEFDKDDDTHASLVTACGNLRARNYAIEEVDKHRARGIAGKIIPAIATTTGLVVGLIMLELYKLHTTGDSKGIDDYKSCFANLALPLFSFSNPVDVPHHSLLLPAAATWSPPPAPGSTAASAALPVDAADPAGARAWKWSVWDRVDVEGPKTLEELLKFIKYGMGLDPQMVSYAGAMLYGQYLPVPKKKERMPVHVARLAQTISKRVIAPHVRYLTLEVVANGTKADGSKGEVEVPTIRYKISDAELAWIAEQAAAAAGGSAAADGATA